MVMGRTRWRRFGAVMVVSAGATAGMLALVAHGAIAASFTVSGQQFKVRADRLVANGFVQYGSVDARAVRGKDPEPQPVAVAAMQEATLYNLCQSVVTDLGDFGTVTLRITAGTNDKNPVKARNMVVDMSQLDGNADFKDIEIGRDASTLDRGPTNDPGETAQRQQAFFSQQARTVTIDNLQQVAWATNAADFNLTNLSLRLQWGKNECF
jgi:Family of unknown function (DUF6230)